MNDDAARAETLSRELDSAFRNRADLYRLFYDELSGEYGPEKAEAIMASVVEKRGQEVADLAFSDFGPTDARKIGEAFLAVSPDGGRMYPADVERSETEISFKVKRCPLKDAWVEAGVGDEKLATLCRGTAPAAATSGFPTPPPESAITKLSQGTRPLQAYRACQTALPVVMTGLGVK